MVCSSIHARRLPRSYVYSVLGAGLSWALASAPAEATMNPLSQYCFIDASAQWLSGGSTYRSEVTPAGFMGLFWKGVSAGPARAGQTSQFTAQGIETEGDAVVDPSMLASGSANSHAQFAFQLTSTQEYRFSGGVSGITSINLHGPSAWSRSTTSNYSSLSFDETQVLAPGSYMLDLTTQAVTDSTGTWSLSFEPTPEPSAMLLVTSCLALLARRRSQLSAFERL